jgi:quercetin dioxygenase-like cupin family protein/transcriptional regulator with XRE-family HTH domain
VKNEDCLTVAEVLARTGMTRDQLNLLRKQEYVSTIGSLKGERKVWVYPSAQLPKLKRMAELMRGGMKPQAAAQRADEEIALGHLSRNIPKTVDLRPDVEGREVGRLLSALYRSRAGKLEDLQARLRLWIDIFSAQLKASASPPPPPDNPTLSDYLAWALAGFESLDFPQVRTLAQVLDVHPLLVDPLFSQVEDDKDWLALDQKQFVPVGDSRDRSYGSHVQYHLPSVRLGGTDAMFALVAFESEGESCTHTHPGDELVLCLEGELTVRLQSSGNIALRPFDYVHFDSDQEHLLRNESTDQPAKVLIVRFYQIDKESPSTRELVRQIIAEEPGSQELLARVAPWLPKPGPTANHTAQTMVQDRIGFGKFLTNLRDLAGDSLDQTASRLAEATPELSRSRARELVEGYERGSVEVAEGDLRTIADSYGVNEFLFHSYLSQAVPGAVVVRGLFPRFLEEEFRRNDASPDASALRHHHRAGAARPRRFHTCESSPRLRGEHRTRRPYPRPVPGRQPGGRRLAREQSDPDVLEREKAPGGKRPQRPRDVHCDSLLGAVGTARVGRVRRRAKDRPPETKSPTSRPV